MHGKARQDMYCTHDIGWYLGPYCHLWFWLAQRVIHAVMRFQKNRGLVTNSKYPFSH